MLVQVLEAPADVVMHEVVYRPDGGDQFLIAVARGFSVGILQTVF